MPVAEGGRTPCLARLARPGTGESSLEHCQQAHRPAVVTVAFAQHRGGREVEIDRICIATLFAYAGIAELLGLPLLYRCPMYWPGKGSVIRQPSRAVAEDIYGHTSDATTRAAIDRLTDALGLS